MKEYWLTLTVFGRIKLIVMILLMILLIVFITQNWKEIELSLIFWNVKISLTLIIFLALITGYLISFFTSFKKINKKELEIKKLIKELDEAKKM